MFQDHTQNRQTFSFNTLENGS